MTLQDYLLEAYPTLEWIQRDAAFAEQVGVTRQTIQRYRTFRRFPSPLMISRIREETSGVVTAEDHLPVELRESNEQRARRLRIERRVFEQMLSNLDPREVNRRILQKSGAAITGKAA